VNAVRVQEGCLLAIRGNAASAQDVLVFAFFKSQ
jgi:hypothetical protein